MGLIARGANGPHGRERFGIKNLVMVKMDRVNYHGDRGANGPHGTERFGIKNMWGPGKGIGVIGVSLV